MKNNTPHHTEFREWEEIEHGADIGLRAKAKSLPCLFQSAADGMIALLVDTGSVSPCELRTAAAEGPDGESLLVGWLEEILFMVETGGFAPLKATSVRIEKGKVSGEIAGEKFDTCRHEIFHDIKAVTWHNLKIRESGGLYSVEIIFDV